MSYKLAINPDFPAFEPIVKKIKTIFKQGDQSIHKARNELKIIELEGLQCVVKAFRIPNALNQVAYAYLRNSKAWKSFHNAMTLQSRDVNTPTPIGFIEFYEQGVLKESFFIALYAPYDLTMANVRDDALDDKLAILQAFARYSYELHQKGVWHVDYSGGNILIKRQDESYHFSLVDINRMQFKTIEGYKGLENFNKLWLSEADLTIIAKAYASAAGLNEAKAVAAILEHDRKLKAHVLRRRKLKALFKGR
jgi:tRNA A-37 threonylcarbamoyl transferase component Bud32